MNFTNKFNLPESVVNFITEDRYDPGSSDYSVTTLIDPPQIVQLKRRYWDKLEEDCMDRVWSVFGTAVHNLLEAHTKEGVAEERLYVEIDGVRVGGAMDHVEDGVISDYKVTSVYKVMKDTPQEWIKQQNIYAYLQHANGRPPITKLQICAILRDWSRGALLRDPSYPKAPIQMIELPLWPLDWTEKYLRGRVALHKENASYDHPELTECTLEEMWAQPSKYAIMKEGGKRALRLFDDVEQAHDYLAFDAPKTGCYLETRPGKRTRCEDYCLVKNYCHQYRRYQDGKD